MPSHERLIRTLARTRREESKARVMRMAETTNMTQLRISESKRPVPRWIVGSLVTLALTSGSLHAQVSSPCADSSAKLIQTYRDAYASMVSRTDSETVAFRSSSGLPTLAASQVRIIGDTAVCRAASIAYDSRLLNPSPSLPVIVLELGTKRIVIKESGHPGNRLNMLFSQDFTTWITNLSF